MGVWKRISLIPHWESPRAPANKTSPFPGLEVFSQCHRAAEVSERARKQIVYRRHSVPLCAFTVAAHALGLYGGATSDLPQQDGEQDSGPQFPCK